MTRDMTKENLWKGILLFSLPLMFSNLLQVLFNISDMIVVGNFVGDNALGSVGSTSILIMLFVGFIIGIGGGISSILTRAIGEKNINKLRTCINNSIITIFLVGLIISFLGIVLSKPLLILLKTDSILIDDAITYFRIYMLGMPALAICNYGNAVFSSFGDTKRPLIFLSIGGILNIFLNIFFVTVVNLSVVGVAIASIASQYLAGGMMIMSLSLRKDEYHFSFKEVKFDKNNTIEVLKIGFPGGLQNAVFSVANLFIQSAVNSLGTAAINGCSAAASYDPLVYDIMAAFYMANACYAGQNYGAGKKKRILKSLFITLAYSSLIALIIGVVLVLLRYNAVSLFLNDDESTKEVIEAGSKRILVMGLSYFVSSLMDAPIASSRGMGKTLVPMLVEIIGSCIFRIIWIYTIFAHFATIESLFLLYIFSWILTGILEFIIFGHYYKKIDNFE